MGFGMFCNKVMAKTSSKIPFGNGIESASAQIRATSWRHCMRFFASLRIFKETSRPTRSLMDLPMCSDRSPVPQPASNTM